MRKTKARPAVLDAFRADMRKERPVSSPIDEYLAWMSAEDPDAAAALSDDIISTFTTEEGLRVLKMLEKAVLYAGLPNGSSDGALREHNANRNFVLNIRRIVAHG